MVILIYFGFFSFSPSSLLLFPENAFLACAAFCRHTYDLFSEATAQEGSAFTSAWASGFHVLASVLGFPASYGKSCVHAWHNPGLYLLLDNPFTNQDLGASFSGVYPDQWEEYLSLFSQPFMTLSRELHAGREGLASLVPACSSGSYTHPASSRAIEAHLVKTPGFHLLPATLNLNSLSQTLNDFAFSF